jgi:hypothetical protein
MSGYVYYTKGALYREREIIMPLHDYPGSDPFENQDVINLLTVDELRELSNLKELRVSNIATLRYFEEREGAIFKAARARLPKEGEPHVD